jgi:hypothetical protein
MEHIMFSFTFMMLIDGRIHKFHKENYRISITSRYWSASWSRSKIREDYVGLNVHISLECNTSPSHKYS